MATMFQMRYDVLKVDGLDSDDEGRSKKGKKKQNQNNGQPKQQQNNNKQQQQGGKQQQQQQGGKQQQQQGGKQQQQPKQQQNQKQQQQQQPNKQQQQNKQQNGTGKGNNQNGQNKSADANKAGGKQPNKNGKKENQRWDEWVKADQTTTNDAYEKDLHEALLASKVEYEKVAHEVVENGATSPTESQKDKKKKSKKTTKPVAMNLQEFREGDAKPSKKKSEASPDALPLRLHPEGEANPNFFNDVDKDAEKIVHLGKAYDEYQKQFAQESVRVQKLEERIKRRDNEISMLRTSLQKKEDEYQEVKKRNKQLCCILAQGEMKEKADILLQSDSLSQVNTELTEQVTELTGDLEKERSKVHSLETDIEKLKIASRHQTTK